MIVHSTIDPELTEAKFRHDLIVIRINSFTESTASSFSDQISKAHDSTQPIIPIIVDSYGGSVDALLSMLSDIESSQKPVATIAVGKAMSCGSILLASGTKGYRYADPRARVMIHEVSATARDKASEIKASATEIERLNKQVFELLSAKCGKTPTYFFDEMFKRNNADWFMVPNEALQHGLIDHVRVPTISRSVSVFYEFK